MRAWDGTPLAELATERREILPFEQVPAAAGPRLPRRRGPPLLRARRHRLPRHRARAGRQPARRRGRAGRLDHHAAGGEVVPVVGADHPAQDPRGDPGAPPGARILEARHPDAVPQPDLPRPRRLRRGGGGAPLLRQADRRARPRRDGDCWPAWSARRRASRRSPASTRARSAPRSGAGRDGRRRLPHRRRGEPLARAPGDHPPAARLLPHRLALLRRARAPRHHPPLRREEALRGRPRHRDHGAALDRRRRRRRTSTSRCASSTSGRAGAARWRASPAPPPTSSAAASPPATAPSRRPRGSSTWASSRATADGGATACASARTSTRCRSAEHAVGGPLQRQGRRQRHASSTRRSACCAPATSSG